MLMFFLSFSLHAQEKALEGVWLTAEKRSKIEIWQAKDQLFYGKIAWLEEENQDKKDVNNPEPSKRDNLLLGTVILMGFDYDSEENEWSGGYAYDPESGKRYEAFMWLDENNPDQLHLKGYIMGMRWMGRTESWKRVR